MSEELVRLTNGFGADEANVFGRWYRIHSDGAFTFLKPSPSSFATMVDLDSSARQIIPACRLSLVAASRVADPRPGARPDQAGANRRADWA
jgi:hypothetical protein